MANFMFHDNENNEFEGILHTGKAFSDDIATVFGLDKIVKAISQEEKLKITNTVVLDGDTVMK